MLHHVPTPALQDRLLAEARRVLRPGGVFAGFDGVGSFPCRLIHLGDTYTPVKPETLGQRLEAVGFTDVAVERRRARFRFRATQGNSEATAFCHLVTKGMEGPNKPTAGNAGMTPRLTIGTLRPRGA